METKLQFSNNQAVSKGYGLIATSVIEEGSISKEAKILYTYFVCKAGANSHCFPANKTIMRALGIKSKISLQKYKEELIDAELLEIKERKTKSGRVTSNYYYPKKLIFDQAENDEAD